VERQTGIGSSRGAGKQTHAHWSGLGLLYETDMVLGDRGVKKFNHEFNIFILGGWNECKEKSWAEGSACDS